MAQTTPNTPLARRTAAFGSKADLITRLKGLATEELWVGRLNDTKAWNGISNAKLMRLHDVLTIVKDKYGSRAKLIDALLDAQGRSKDADYRKHFETWPVPRLFDALQSAEKRSGKKAEAKKSAAEGAPKAEAKKSVAKKPAAKRTAAPKAAAGSKAAAKKPAAKKSPAKKG